MVVLARLDGGAIAALVAGVIFLAIMGYLLFGPGTEKQPPEPQRKRPAKPRR